MQLAPRALTWNEAPWSTAPADYGRHTFDIPGKKTRSESTADAGVLSSFLLRNNSHADYGGA
jgi:hypothetical protein